MPYHLVGSPELFASNPATQNSIFWLCQIYWMLERSSYRLLFDDGDTPHISAKPAELAGSISILCAKHTELEALPRRSVYNYYKNLGLESKISLKDMRTKILQIIKDSLACTFQRAQSLLFAMRREEIGGERIHQALLKARTAYRAQCRQNRIDSRENPIVRRIVRRLHDRKQRSGRTDASASGCPTTRASSIEGKPARQLPTVLPLRAVQEQHHGLARDLGGRGQRGEPRRQASLSLRMPVLPVGRYQRAGGIVTLVGSGTDRSKVNQVRAA